MNARRRAAIATLVVSAAMVVTESVTAPAQAVPSVVAVFRPRIVGVYDETSGNPIADVEVRNLLNGMSALTSTTGTVALTFVDTSGGMLSFKKIGYEQMTLVVANSPRDTAPLTLTMKSAGHVLPTVVTSAVNLNDRVDYTSPALKGFEERRHQGFGRFIAESELRKHDGERLSDVALRYLPGLQLVTPPCSVARPSGCAQYFASQRGRNTMGPGVCYVTVYIDGALYYSSKSTSSTPPEPRTMNVNEYAGVEFYNGGATMPPQYNGTDAGCGVLLLWTRER